MKICCTIITKSHLHFAEALQRSLQLYCYDAKLYTLVVDLKSKEDYPGLNCLSVHDLGPGAKAYLERYSSSPDKLRWSLKPVLMIHLLRTYPDVVFLDPDLCFFSSIDFIFQQLETIAVLLTPHRATYDPFRDPEKFKMNFTAGLYNAGFVGANTNATSVLQWWAKACLFEVDKIPSEGLLDDQRYLDLFPVLEPNTRVLEHEGCNVGSWNIETCRRVVQSDGSVRINGRFPIVFIHFNQETIHHIQAGNDPALLPYLKTYRKLLNQTKTSETAGSGNTEPTRGVIEIKRKLRLRTRLKRMLYMLYQKL